MPRKKGGFGLTTPDWQRSPWQALYDLQINPIDPYYKYKASRHYKERWER